MGRDIEIALSAHFVGEVVRDSALVDAFLVAGIAVADGDGVVLFGLTVDGEAIGRARFVHAGVAFADRLLDVVLARPAPADRLVNGLSDLGHAVLGHQREDRRLDRSEPRMELHQLGARAGVVDGVGFAETPASPGRRRRTARSRAGRTAPCARGRSS